MSLPSLYKYLSKPEYADSFIRGELRFNSLAYFRDYEADEGVRADALEGTRIYRPEGGLRGNNLTTGEKFLLADTAFTSSANHESIFVLCLSTELSIQIAQRFSATVCVEIKDPGAFLASVRSHLQLRKSVDPCFHHGKVNYYDAAVAPIIDWALPEIVARSKSNSFEWQQEYRIAFAEAGAFRIENVQLSLQTKFMPFPQAKNHTLRKIRIGSIRRFCRLHRLL